MHAFNCTNGRVTGYGIDTLKTLFNQQLYKMNTQTKQQQIEAAANHFIGLYSEEIKAGEQITGDAIHEWWGLTVDQYGGLSIDDFEAIEAEIFNRI